MSKPHSSDFPKKRNEEADPEHHRQRQGCALSCLTADVRQKAMSPLDTAKISSKEELAEFVGALMRDHAKYGSDWENPDLPRFLEALQAWLAVSDRYYANVKEDPGSISPYRRIADALAAARIYE
jgi:hypothetical protein